MNDELLFLASEVALLKSILTDIPEDRVTYRLSFEARLAKAEAELAALEPPQHRA